MKKTIIAAALVCLSFGVQPTYAQSPIVPLAKRSIPEIVEYFANQYKVSAPQMLATMRCESSLNVKAVGDSGTSFGIAQIHLPAHRDITREQAQDAVFATEFMAREFARSNQKIWSCYQMLYGGRH